MILSVVKCLYISRLNFINFIMKFEEKNSVCVGRKRIQWSLIFLSHQLMHTLIVSVKYVQHHRGVQLSALCGVRDEGVSSGKYVIQLLMNTSTAGPNSWRKSLKSDRHALKPPNTCIIVEHPGSGSSFRSFQDACTY